MFQPFRREPKAYETTAQNTSAALAQLMAALQGAAQGGADISKQAGTSIARDRLAAMSPEDRAGTNVLDKIGGLALTDQFRKRLEQGEQDAVARNVADAKNTFTTERDAKLNEYDIAKDQRRLSRELATAKTRGTSKSGIQSNPEDELAISELDRIAEENLTAIAANDTQDGIGLGEKSRIVQQAQKAKYDLLRKMNYPEVTARKMAYEKSPGLTMLEKRLYGNKKKQTSKK